MKSLRIYFFIYSLILFFISCSPFEDSDIEVKDIEVDNSKNLNEKVILIDEFPQPSCLYIGSYTGIFIDKAIFARGEMAQIEKVDGQDLNDLVIGVRKSFLVRCEGNSSKKVRQYTSSNWPNNTFQTTLNTCGLDPGLYSIRVANLYNGIPESGSIFEINGGAYTEFFFEVNTDPNSEPDFYTLNDGDNIPRFNVYPVFWNKDKINDDFIVIEVFKNGVFHSTLNSVENNDGLYNDYMVLPIGSDYQIKVSSFNNPNDYVISGFFNVNNGVSQNGVITPNSEQDNWSKSNDPYPVISWDPSLFPNASKVIIHMYKENEFYKTVAITNNDGSYANYINHSGYPTGGQFRIKISGYDADHCVFDFSDAYFDIIP